ncbi:MAG: hypothetical protein E7317_01150 [Clostridiales bacterium]|nr:hypothetical protein [Clostridiales bacterium]
MTVTKMLFLIAMLGHLLLAWCDCLLIYAGGEKFGFSLMKDGAAMRKVFSRMPARNPLMSMLFGCLALCMCSGGYYALYLWMRPFSQAAALIMLLGCVLFFIPGTAHHVFCGAAEWFYIRMGMTEQAREAVTDFFRKTSAAMIACYVGMAAFGVTLFAMVVSGATPLPAWACAFNELLIAAVLFPLRIGGAGNWAGAAMFLSLLLLT